MKPGDLCCVIDSRGSRFGKSTVQFGLYECPFDDHEGRLPHVNPGTILIFVSDTPMNGAAEDDVLVILPGHGLTWVSEDFVERL